MYYKSFDDVKFDLCSFKVKLGRVSIKVPISRLLLVLEVSNVQSPFRKSLATNLFVVTDFSFVDLFKVKLCWTNIKVHI